MKTDQWPDDWRVMISDSNLLLSDFVPHPTLFSFYKPDKCSYTGRRTVMVSSENKYSHEPVKRHLRNMATWATSPYKM